ncbi:pirin family protein [Alteromonas gilva]|uniref:Pirin family protein n=1 Tax=Alteromonas gilva TaxID=2987522 RepID=A0ABT5L1M1_9ALTE|nr:pirin family protein [Alteromonas gilva]MDC8830944.1 pirin family protein [Alteromonas gilva]
MKNRGIKQKVTGMPTQDGAGVSLTRIIGQRALPNLDPFLMLDFFGSDKPNEYIAGFPPHPHRGFQTVTYMLTGKMGHKDSVGNEGIIEDGGIQWMNAGKGIIHEEMPQQTDGLLRGFQLWVNLPAADKLSPPGYQDIKPEAVPVVTLNENVSAKVLAGELMGESGPVNTAKVKPLFLDVHWQPGMSVDIPVTAGHSAFLYCYEGTCAIDNAEVNTGELAVFEDGDQVSLSAATAGKAILVAAAPINEPVVQYGPFVMNTEAEIHQAIRDYQQGRLTQ